METKSNGGFGWYEIIIVKKNIIEIDLFHIVNVHACIAHVTRYISIIDNEGKWGFQEFYIPDYSNNAFDLESVALFNITRKNTPKFIHIIQEISTHLFS